jgi:retron-type reverse transcriptase
MNLTQARAWSYGNLSLSWQGKETSKDLASSKPILEPIFDKDSYGYRPGKSAHDAVEVTRKRCWKSAWVLEFDIKGLFDNIPHDLLIKALPREE